MLKFKVAKVEGRYTKTCQCCKKKHKRGYHVEEISFPRHINWINGFVCSKKCADMWILSRI